MYNTTLSLTSALEEVGGQHHTPTALPPRNDPVLIVKNAGRTPPPGFDPRTVQPLASRYTDWTIPAHIVLIRGNNEEAKIYAM
jgi:hypothetical protein